MTPNSGITKVPMISISSVPAGKSIVTLFPSISRSSACSPSTRTMNGSLRISFDGFTVKVPDSVEMIDTTIELSSVFVFALVIVPLEILNGTQ